MRRVAMALVLVLAIAAIAFAGPKGKKYKEHTIYGKNYDKQAVEQLLDDSDGPAEVFTDQNGVGELKGKFKLDKSKKVEEAALDFIDRHRHAFMLKEPKKELKLKRKNIDKWGLTDIHYQQTYKGVPIWGEILSIHSNHENNINEVDSNLIPTPDIDTTPHVTEEEAVEIVKKGIEDIGEVVDKFDPSIETGLVIYIAANKPLLCYTVTISTEIPTGSWLFFVDAKKGKIITREPLSFSDGPISGSGVFWNGTTVDIGLYESR